MLFREVRIGDFFIRKEKAGNVLYRKKSNDSARKIVLSDYLQAARLDDLSNFTANTPIEPLLRMSQVVRT